MYDILTSRKDFPTMQIAINSTADIEALLIKLISEGNPDTPRGVVGSKTVPFKDIKGFDSLSALEILTELEEETGIHVEDEIFYVDVKPKKFRSIQETASAIWAELQKGGKQHA
jgi:acyl carrier protein